MASPASFVDDKLEQGSNPVNVTSSSDIEKQITGLYQLGRPHNFPQKIDPGQRVTNYLKTKMHVVDLIPCFFKLNLAEVGDKAESDAGLLPRIQYAEAISDYQTDCGYYGLSNQFGGIRIYTTDETSIVDTFQNNRSPNVLHQIASGLHSKFQSFRQLGDSFGDDLSSVVNGQAVDGFITDAAGLIGGGLDALGITTSANQPTTDENGQPTQQKQGLISAEAGTKIGTVLTKSTSLIAHSVIAGERVSFPTIWEDSSYAPSFTLNIKLAAPAGHPKAIKEFIIRPLMHLLILGGAKTTNGITYGRPYTMTLKAYGLNYSPLVAISNITLRRGGASSAFNVYRQPMIVDVSLEFDFLLSGFASYKGSNTDSRKPEKDIFKIADQMVDSESTHMVGDTACIPTLGKVISSFMPVKINSHVDTLIQKAENAPNTIHPTAAIYQPINKGGGFKTDSGGSASGATASNSSVSSPTVKHNTKIDTNVSSYANDKIKQVVDASKQAASSAVKKLNSLL